MHIEPNEYRARPVRAGVKKNKAERTVAGKMASGKRVSREVEDEVVQPGLLKKIKPYELAEQLAFGQRKITKTTLAELRKEMPDLAARYEQLADLPAFEHKPMSAQERMHLAYLIEVEAPKIGRIRDACLIATGPRDVYVTKKRKIVIMAKPELSQLSAKGSWKEVFSGVKLSTLKKPVKPLAIARIPLNTQNKINDVDEEMEFFNRLQKAKVPGIAKPRFYTDITGMKKNPADYVHKFPVEEYLSHKVAAFDRYERSLEGENGFSPQEKVSVAAQITETVKKMHDAGVIHWDLKRENVLIKREEGKIITALTDLGLSFDKNDPYELHNYGTAVSSAPELINQADFRGDVVKVEAWSLGIVLYEMLFERNVPWKETLPPPETFIDLGARKQKTLLTQYKKSIPSYVEGFASRIKQLERQKHLSPPEKLEAIIYGLLRVDPEKRLSIDEAFHLISGLL